MYDILSRVISFINTEYIFSMTRLRVTGIDDFTAVPTRLILVAHAAQDGPMSTPSLDTDNHTTLEPDEEFDIFFASCGHACVVFKLAYDVRRDIQHYVSVLI